LPGTVGGGGTATADLLAPASEATALLRRVRDDARAVFLFLLAPTLPHRGTPGGGRRAFPHLQTSNHPISIPLVHTHPNSNSRLQKGLRRHHRGRLGNQAASLPLSAYQL